METADDARFMRLALEACRRGIEAGQSPFGACLVRDGQVLAAAHNRVWLTSDPTAHAEVVAVRAACQRLRSIDLSGATIYSTTEPCPMCFAAIHWARIARIVFGARIADARDVGFHELSISNAAMREAGGADMVITPDFLREQALELFRLWRDRPDHRPY